MVQHHVEDAALADLVLQVAVHGQFLGQKIGDVPLFGALAVGECRPRSVGDGKYRPLDCLVAAPRKTNFIFYLFLALLPLPDLVLNQGIGDEQEQHEKADGHQFDEQRCFEPMAEPGESGLILIFHDEVIFVIGYWLFGV